MIAKVHWTILDGVDDDGDDAERSSVVVVVVIVDAVVVVVVVVELRPFRIEPNDIFVEASLSEKNTRNHWLDEFGRKDFLQSFQFHLKRN